MKRYFEIKSYLDFEKTRFYTIEEVGKGVSETDEFFIRFKDNPDYQKDIEIIKYWIQKIGKESGALERHFRPESRAEAIPISSSKLRLYCLRISNEVVILGNGGIKSSQAVQQSPDAFPHFKLMNQVRGILHLKISNQQLKVAGKTISGQMTFFI